MLCCSEQCDRKEQCDLFYRNLQPEYRKYDNLESLATSGWGRISANGYEFHYDCGPFGDYKMFDPLSKPKQYIEKEPLLAYLENMGISKNIINTIDNEDRFSTVSVEIISPSDYPSDCTITSLVFKEEP